MSFDLVRYEKGQIAGFSNVFGKFDRTVVEMGGKFLDDHNATRVLPGCTPDVKIEIFNTFKDDCEIFICINSENIEEGRIQSDYNTKYTEDCMEKIVKFEELGYKVSGVILTVFDRQPKAEEFAKYLKLQGKNVYIFYKIEDYPNCYENMIESFENNEVVQVERKIVVLTSSGAASGKLSASLNILWQQHMQNVKVGYIKYDIFPVWNLDCDHVLNACFTAATADSNDTIVEDYFYEQRFNKKSSNYNRDLDVFPIMKLVLDEVMGEESYGSPTEIVINTVKDAIVDEEVVCQKARQEIYRRYLTYKKQFARGDCTEQPIERTSEIMRKHEIDIEDFPFVSQAEKEFAKDLSKEVVVIEFGEDNICIVENLPNVTICSSIKRMLKLGELNAIKKVESLAGKNLHSSFLISKEEEEELQKLGILVTCKI